MHQRLKARLVHSLNLMTLKYIKVLFEFQSAEIKANVIKYFKEIADVLAYVNRQMILIFKVIILTSFWSILIRSPEY